MLLLKQVGKANDKGDFAKAQELALATFIGNWTVRDGNTEVPPNMAEWRMRCRTRPIKGQPGRVVRRFTMVSLIPKKETHGKRVSAHQGSESEA